MKTDIRSALKGLQQVRRLAIQGAEEGLAGAAPAIQGRMESTTAHGDDTGATRSGYVAYVVGPSLDGSGAVGVAAGRVEDLNPNRSHVENVGDAGGDVVLIATTPTDYAWDLISRAGGKFDAIGPAVVGEAGMLHAVVVNGIRRRLGG